MAGAVTNSRSQTLPPTGAQGATRPAIYKPPVLLSSSLLNRHVHLIPFASSDPPSQRHCSRRVRLRAPLYLGPCAQRLRRYVELKPAEARVESNTILSQFPSPRTLTTPSTHTGRSTPNATTPHGLLTAPALPHPPLPSLPHNYLHPHPPSSLQSHPTAL
jgi:hypothetical protein